ncbi:hypothetical protein ABTE34_21770, partial [Acinetobacter baumannii]
TMKMIGLSQRLPYPGKRNLREAIASHDAEAADANATEVIGRVARDIKVVYYDLAYAAEATRQVGKSRAVLAQLLLITE